VIKLADRARSRCEGRRAATPFSFSHAMPVKYEKIPTFAKSHTRTQIETIVRNGVGSGAIFYVILFNRGLLTKWLPILGGLYTFNAFTEEDGSAPTHR
jgi:hypothetical protein